MVDAVYTQDGFGVRMEWGGGGLTALLGGCGVLVIVDVLSFSTSVDVAVARGARILPLPLRDERAAEAARAAGAVLAGEREWTLRPRSLTGIPAGTLLALPSPNGATLSARAASGGAAVLAGCLRNASAVAAKAAELADGRPIGVIAAGERWASEGHPLRPSVEDLVGAGAIIGALVGIGVGSVSPEAAIAWSAAPAHLAPEKVLTECSSGRELIAKGHRGDVELAGEWDASTAAPVLVDGVFTNGT